MRRNVLTLVTTARDAVLQTREGQALSRAVIAGVDNVLADSNEQQNLRTLVTSGRKAVCIGKNYLDHISELSQLGPEWNVEAEAEPVIFLKPTTSYAWPGEPLVLPRSRGHVTVKHGVQHELELAVIIGKRVKGERDHQAAMQAIAGYVLAID
eukprot:3586961-Pleurochrysis_carterae.AAC.1